MALPTSPQPDSHPELPIDPDVLQPRNLQRPPHLTIEFQAVVFAGDCLGTLARYGVIRALPAGNDAWPIATFTVNIIGAFMLGLLLAALARRGKDIGARRLIRLVLGTGFMGAFTTYSSLAVDTSLLIRHNNSVLAVVYSVVSASGGILACMLGIRLASGESAHRRQAR